MTKSGYGPHWASVLRLRDEVRATDGSVGELQMSLAKAVYQTVPVPYAKCDYYTDITQPTPLLVGFLGRVARRLGVPGLDSQAAFHLDQGMGGGKSHALVGLWHMISSSETFFASDLGKAVSTHAGVGSHAPDLADVVPVVLIGDSMSPGKTDPRFGPATDLFGRFLWLAFDRHPERLDRWQHYYGLGGNKATLQAVFAELGHATLIVIDELMDYAMALTDSSAIGGLPGEQAFLNALTDAVDDQPQVALIVVMIRSDEDSSGYHPAAEEMRQYLALRLQRNGETVTVTEPADFAQIIRRRLFARADILGPAGSAASAYVDAATESWDAEVYGNLGTGRTLPRLGERISETYPFHPDLFELVAREWSKVQAFQRVRSTVAIFARTVLHWVSEHEAGHWAPHLIGPGDLPLHTDALEALLSSGVLAGNDRAIQGFRAVANTDIVRSGGGAGAAYALDLKLASSGVDAGQPAPAVRMATACFAYSLVPRGQAARGATKAELLAAVAGPGVPFNSAEEVFNALVAGPTEGGLGALEHTKAVGRNGWDRYYLSIKQTLTMYHANALSLVSTESALNHVWKRTQQLTTRGAFTGLHFVEPPPTGPSTAAACFAGVDGQENRLVVLDPRRWTLLNGRDAPTRADLDVAFGVAPGLTATYTSSMVMALVNTQRRARASSRAKEYLAWDIVVRGLTAEDEEYAEAASRRDATRVQLDIDIRAAFQHYAYLLRTQGGLTVQYKHLPDGKTSLNGQDVWVDLVGAGRAVAVGALSAAYVGQLIANGNFGRDLTPKELFALPYSNSTWPLIADDADLRQALFLLATGAEWMLADSVGNEIRPASPGQIQPGSMQQVLRSRVAQGTTDEQQPDSPATPTGSYTVQPVPSTVAVVGSAPSNPSVTIAVAPVSPSLSGQGSAPLDYEVTRLRLPITSLADDAKRTAVWMLVREVASLLDAARGVDIQMISLDIGLTAAAGSTGDLAGRIDSVPGATVSVEPDDL